MLTHRPRRTSLIITFHKQIYKCKSVNKEPNVKRIDLCLKKFPATKENSNVKILGAETTGKLLNLVITHDIVTCWPFTFAVIRTITCKKCN